MRVGSLFSGIGGLERGLEQAGMTTAWQVEIDEFASQILAAHWPAVDRHKDVTEVGSANLAAVDIICGGFPCQDISPANSKGKGLNGEKSGLWREYSRIVGELKPRWVLVENNGKNWKKWVPTVRGDLWRLGYSSLSIRLRASDFGAPHERSRVFVVATNIVRPRWGIIRSFSAQKKKSKSVGLSKDGPAPNVDSVRELQPEGGISEEWRWPCNEAWWRAEPSMARVVHGLSKKLDGVARTKVLGNAVCPPIAKWLGEMIMSIDEESLNQPCT